MGLFQNFFFNLRIGTFWTGSIFLVLISIFEAGTPTHSALCTTENSNALTELANYQFSQDISTVCTNEHWVSALDKALKRLLWRVVFHDAESRQIRRLSISFKLNHCVTMLLSIVRSPYTLSFYSFLSCVADRKSFGKKKKRIKLRPKMVELWKIRRFCFQWR